MTAISSLTQSSSLSAADQLLVYSAGTGVDSRLSLSVLLSYLQDELGVKSMVTQYEAPQATGFNVTPLVALAYVILGGFLYLSGRLAIAGDEPAPTPDRMVDPIVQPAE